MAIIRKFGATNICKPGVSWMSNEYRVTQYYAASYIGRQATSSRFAMEVLLGTVIGVAFCPRRRPCSSSCVLSKPVCGPQFNVLITSSGKPTTKPGSDCASAIPAFPTTETAADGIDDKSAAAGSWSFAHISPSSNADAGRHLTAD